MIGRHDRRVDMVTSKRQAAIAIMRVTHAIAIGQILSSFPLLICAEA